MKCSINQTVNDLRTKLPVKTFITEIGAKLESLVNVSAAEVEVSDSGGEKISFHSSERSRDGPDSIFTPVK